MKAIRRVISGEVKLTKRRAWYSLVSQGWEVVVHLKDKAGDPTDRTYKLIATDDAGDMSEMQINATAIITDLLAVTDCKIDQYRIAKVFVEDAFTLPTADTAETRTHAMITLPIAGVPNKSATIDIPGPKNGIFVAASGSGYNDVDPNDSDVDNYVNNFAAVGVGGIAYISDGENIVNENLRGKRTHSRSTKG